ncbi:2TM domain-containing protein [Halomicronema sp. CCY15110]|uniref:2TM domain-containing protein n=1 Tax=Halomicronema sp. CCY15110 TaxID=2767773 RepID=UPI00194DDF11|nr:2TM domain-containing protein [Halomicronema sp. CCY15110]
MSESTIVPPSQDEPASYQSEDAQAILQIAIARHTEDGELTRSQLFEIADELGIAPTTLREAEQQWALQQQESVELAEFNQYQQQCFQSHLVRFAIINSVLLILNWMAADTLSWALYILVFWGAGLSLQAWQTYWPNEQQYRNRFEKWRRREQIKRSFSRAMDWLLGT